MSDDVLEAAQASEVAQATEMADTSDTTNTATAVEPAATEQTAETAAPTDTADTVTPAATAATEMIPYSGNSGQDHVERMRMIMIGFIDDPRKAALDADDLLAEVLRSVTESLARRRRELETESSDAATPDTERLRQAVRRSRELVDVLTQAV